MIQYENRLKVVVKVESRYTKELARNNKWVTRKNSVTTYVKVLAIGPLNDEFPLGCESVRCDGSDALFEERLADTRGCVQNLLESLGINCEDTLTKLEAEARKYHRPCPEA